MSYQEKTSTIEGTAPYAVPETLQRGSFYWVRIVEGDERNNVIPETSWQPARYTGRSGTSVGDTWDFLGRASADGHHHVDVMQVGDIIQPVL